MKKFAFIALSILAIALLTSTSDAGGCVVRQRNVVVQHQAAAVVVAQVVPVVAAVFTPAVVVPAYSVGYSDHHSGSQIELLKNQLEVEKLKNRVQQLEFNGKTPTSPAPQPAPPVIQPKDSPKMPAAQENVKVGEHPAVAIMQKNCLKCHSADAFKAKGGGFDLTGQLTKADLLNVVNHVQDNSMPKNGKLNDQDVAEIFDWVKLATPNAK